MNSSSLLTEGQWSNNGCFRNDMLSNIAQTVCECYHLTHFAILLSPVPLNFTRGVELSLQVIGYIGVAISLVAMAVTIATFIFLKYDCYLYLEKFVMFICFQVTLQHA